MSSGLWSMSLSFKRQDITYLVICRKADVVACGRGLSHLHHAHCVIPAKAGIHGLGGEFEQRSLVKRTCPAMDPRVREDDNIG